MSLQLSIVECFISTSPQIFQLAHVVDMHQSPIEESHITPSSILKSAFSLTFVLIILAILSLFILGMIEFLFYHSTLYAICAPIWTYHHGTFLEGLLVIRESPSVPKITGLLEV